MLSAQMQRLATRHQQLQAGAVLQQARHRRRSRRHLLEVVEDQQQVLVAQPLAQLVEERLGGCRVQADRARDRSEHRLAVAGRRDVDEEHAVLEAVGRIGRGAERQPCLSDAARPRERQQPDRVVCEAVPRSPRAR